MVEPAEKGRLVGYGRTADIFTWGDDQVLKLFHENWSVAAVEEEARIGRLVRDMGLPVPDVSGTVQDGGRFGVIYERVDGPTMLQRFQRAPWTLHQLMGVFADLQASLHEHRGSDLPSRRESMLGSIENAQSVPAMMKESALQVLERLPDDDFLCHGNFHPDQIIMSKKGPIIIDWITATKGSPAADVARSSLILRLGAPPAGRASEWLIKPARSYAHFRYLNRYLRNSSISRQAINDWEIPVAVDRLGTDIPEEREQLLRLIDALVGHRS